MSEEAELPSPPATIVSRRASRSAMPERLKVAARDDSSDDEWDPEEVAGASDEEDSCLRGLQKVIARECSEETIFCRACGKVPA